MQTTSKGMRLTHLHLVLRLLSKRRDPKRTDRSRRSQGRSVFLALLFLALFCPLGAGAVISSAENELLIAKAHILYSKGEYPKALKGFLESYRSDPQKEVLWGAIQAAMKLKVFDRAEQLLILYRDMESSFRFADYYLGLMKLRLRKWEEAEFYLNQAAREDELAPYALFGLAKLYGEKGEADLAKEAFEEAIAIEPRFGEYVTLSDITHLQITNLQGKGVSDAEGRGKVPTPWKVVVAAAEQIKVGEPQTVSLLSEHGVPRLFRFEDSKLLGNLSLSLEKEGVLGKKNGILFQYKGQHVLPEANWQGSFQAQAHNGGTFIFMERETGKVGLGAHLLESLSGAPLSHRSLEITGGPRLHALLEGGELIVEIMGGPKFFGSLEESTHVSQNLEKKLFFKQQADFTYTKIFGASKRSFTLWYGGLQKTVKDFVYTSGGLVAKGSFPFVLQKSQATVSLGGELGRAVGSVFQAISVATGISYPTYTNMLLQLNGDVEVIHFQGMTGENFSWEIPWNIGLLLSYHL